MSPFPQLQGAEGGAGQVQGLPGSGVNCRRAPGLPPTHRERASESSPEDKAGRGLSGPSSSGILRCGHSPGFLLLQSLLSAPKRPQLERMQTRDQTPGLATQSEQPGSDPLPTPAQVGTRAACPICREEEGVGRPAGAGLWGESPAGSVHPWGQTTEGSPRCH